MWREVGKRRGCDLAHSTANHKMFQNSEKKLLPENPELERRSWRGATNYRSAGENSSSLSQSSKATALCSSSLITRLAVLKGSRFMQLVAHYETLQGVC